MNQFKNPPEGFETFTINHFKSKEKEIIETANFFIENTIDQKNKKIVSNFIKEFEDYLEEINL